MGKKKEVSTTEDVVEMNKNGSFALDKSQQGIIGKATGKVNEFFFHLVQYGGFSFDEGAIMIWGDPSFFIPMDAFVNLFRNLEKKLGINEAHQLFYWLGCLYGKNSTLMLIKKFGADKKDIPNFVNGATQDGMGYLEIKYYDADKTKTGEVIGTNSSFAHSYKEKYGTSKESIDYYLAGILSGGTEPLFDLDLKVEEKECICKGDNHCLYFFSVNDDLSEPLFFKKIKINPKLIKQKTLEMALKRRSNFRIFNKKEIKFGDGSFVLKGVKGINFPSYGFVVLNKIIEKLLGKDEYLKILDEFIDSCVYSIKEKLDNQKQLRDFFKELNIFGLGSFNLSLTSKSKIILSNSNSPYPRDYLSLFGREKLPIDILSSKLIQKTLLYKKIKNRVIEKDCYIKNSEKCIYSIEL